MFNSGNSLFEEPDVSAPLAARMRPRALEDVVGQKQALRPGAPLWRMVKNKEALSAILYGPPGTGKTTLAQLVSEETDRHFVALSAAENGVKEVRQAVDSARKLRAEKGLQTVMFVDEIHRFTKSQQDSLLAAVENGWVSLIAATTENPSVSVIRPLLSRSTIIRLTELSKDDLTELVKRAVTSEKGLNSEVSLTEDALNHLVELGGGDGRKTLTILDAAAGMVKSVGEKEVTAEILERAVGLTLPKYDKGGNGHYNTISAFIKSIRGSDPDAALLYLARMLAAGEDPRFIARRLVISASEDIGTADSGSLQVATSAASAVALLGMPEASYPLAHATIHLAMAPKSDAVSRGLWAANKALEKDKGDVPLIMVNVGGGAHPQYKNPHLEPEGVVKQDYLPTEHKGSRFYHPKETGFESKFKERLTWLLKKVRP